MRRFAITCWCSSAADGSLFEQDLTCLFLSCTLVVTMYAAKDDTAKTRRVVPKQMFLGYLGYRCPYRELAEG